ncbi:DivIVA domain-containing protein [Sporanaerobacter acetigenes]|uniref:Cell division initiation protein n=1 Tax=Sporanaerobacter acetigenes DSM 13106 TaxID=1123281 RepID=A0A1M5XW05_9FIRM|nr:DivIVA domain-containing protein [Sporanaerobacter acetigenes]SHI03936.1 cell division initiation protein [Sporanaerobacter acetigenes DSM 13106]
MLTPLDIQNKDFNKSFRGYNATEVDSFLDEIIVDYEKLYKENIELKEKITILNDQLKQYNNLEDTLKNTLVVAQGTAEEVTNTAKQKADLIIMEAEEKSRRIIENAHDEVIKIQEEYESLRKEIYIFKTRFKSLIEAQLSTLDDYYNEIESASSKESVDEFEGEKEIENIDRTDDMGA